MKNFTIASLVLILLSFASALAQNISVGIPEQLSGFQILEVASVPGCTTSPFPADGSVDVPYGPITFSWSLPTTGDPAVSYDLYSGPSATDLTFISNYPTNSTGTDLNNMAYGATVFWQAIAINAEGSAVGCSVWSFTTEAAPGYCFEAIFGQYPSENFTPGICDAVTENVIVTDGYAGEYSVVNLTNGQSYTFTSSVTTDFITISNLDGDASLAAGTTPVSWTANFSGLVRFYTHSNIECGSDSENRTRAVICGFISTEIPDYVNLQYPAAATIITGNSVSVYGQIYETGLTEPIGQAVGIEAWVGVNDSNSDPSTWLQSTWILADYNQSQPVSNNDEYVAAIGANLPVGTYYYATRFRLNSGIFVYGGTDGTNGNFWNGTTYNSGVLTITAAATPVNDECLGAINLVPGYDFDSGALTTTNIGATASDGIAPSCQAAVVENVWYSVQVPASGNITLETGAIPGSLFYDTIMSVFSGTCGTLSEIGCNDDNNGLLSLISLVGRTPGETLYVSVWRFIDPVNAGSAGVFKMSAYDASLGIEDLQSNTLNWFPNPVKDQLNLTDEENLTHVSIFNIVGQLLAEKVLHATIFQFDMTAFSKGTYVIKVRTDTKIKTFKILKE